MEILNASWSHRIRGYSKNKNSKKRCVYSSFTKEQKILKFKLLRLKKLKLGSNGKITEKTYWEHTKIPY